MPALPHADPQRCGRAPTCPRTTYGGRPAAEPLERQPRIIGSPCASTSSPAPPSRSGSTSCGRSPRGSNTSGWPGSAGAPPGSPADGRSSRTATSGPSATTPVASAVGAVETTSAARPPPPAVAALDAGARRHAAVRRPGRPLRLQPQRRPARLQGRSARRTGPQGRIHGRADTEVGARWLEDAWRPTSPPRHLLGALHDRFGGQAEPRRPIAATARPHHYAGNGENPVFSFRLGRIGVVSTGHLLARPVAVPASSPRARPIAGWSAARTHGRPSDRRRRLTRRVAGRPGARRSRARQRVGSRRRQARATPRPDDRGPARRCRVRRLAASGRSDGAASRPGAVRISLYWLGLSSIFAGLSLIMASRLEFTGLVDKAEAGHGPCSWSRSAARVIAVIVQPTIGSISRLHDLALGPPQAVHLHRLASSTSSSSSGSPPATRSSRSPRSSPCSSSARTSPRARSRATSRTSCPRPQVGTASALVGLMQVLGVVSGYTIGALAAAAHNTRSASWRSASSRSSTMLSRRHPRPRGPGAEVARAVARGARSPREAWGTDILRERSFLWLVASRLRDPDGRVRR